MDGPNVHGLLLSMLHSTHSMPTQPHAPADADAVGAEQACTVVSQCPVGSGQPSACMYVR